MAPKTEPTLPSEKPILFSSPMIRALLAGTKTVTRRTVNLREFGKSDTRGYDWTFRDRRALWQDYSDAGLVASKHNHYGAAGDRLWVRESIERVDGVAEFGAYCAMYSADSSPAPVDTWVWQRPKLPSIHMPRGVCRLVLDVVSVRVERLHDITEDDAAREGVTWGGDKIAQSARDAFRCLCDAINPDTWAANPYVWRVEFKRLNQGAS